MRRGVAGVVRAGVAAGLLACAPVPAGAGTLVALGNSGGSLSESLSRESLAAGDRAVEAMSARLGPGDERLLVCLAAASAGADPAVADSASAALRRLSSVPWRGGDAARAAFAAFAASLCGQDLPASLSQRFPREVRAGGLSPAEAVLAFLALDAAFSGRPGADFESAARWDLLAERRLGADPGPRAVTVRAIARDARARARGTQGPGPDVLAHVRWLSARLFPESPRPGAEPGPRTPLDPETAFLLSILADGLPRRAVAAAGGAGRGALFPPDWRSRIADALVSSQVDDPEGGASWDRADEGVNAFAVLALFRIAL